MKKALSLILVCLFLVSMMIPVSAAQFINAYSEQQIAIALVAVLCCDLCWFCDEQAAFFE